jgi:predicted RNase H-like HicB family nuclease
VSAKRCFSLVELKVKELEDCGRVREGLEEELREAREALEGVKAAHSARTVEVSDVM